MFRRLTFNLWYLRKPPWDSGISPPELLEFIQFSFARQSHRPRLRHWHQCYYSHSGRLAGHRRGFCPESNSHCQTKTQEREHSRRSARWRRNKTQRISNQYDLALDLGCFHSLTQQGRQDYLNQLDRILAPNGFWLLYSFLSPGPPQSAPGLAEAEIDIISTRFTLLSRQNGFDKRERPSAWFLFQKEHR